MVRSDVFSIEAKENDEAELLTLAITRMKAFNPSRLISQEEINAEFGFNFDLDNSEET